MIKRFAFASLAVAGLAGPASALDAPFAGEAAGASEGERAPPKRLRRIVKSRIVAVTPPRRPEDAPEVEVAEAAAPAIPDVPAPAGEARAASALADGVQTVAAPGEAVAVLPPLRPSIGPAASALADVQEPGPAVAEAAEDAARADAQVVALLPPVRPAFRGDRAKAVETLETASLPAEPDAAPAAPEANLFGSLFGSAPQTPILPQFADVPVSSGRAGLDTLITAYARLNGVPVDLVHRVVVRESKYNPRAVGRGGAMGLMQIKTGTARALGYGGGPSGLLDAETNLTYAVKYLAGAYRTANGDYGRAISYYARGYYYAAKRNGSLREASNRGRRRDGGRQEADATPPGVTWSTAAVASESATNFR